MQTESFQQILQRKPAGREQIFSQNLLLVMSKKFRKQTFMAVSGNLGGKIPVVDNVLAYHEQDIYTTTSLDSNFEQFEFQTNWNFYVDFRQKYLALKLKVVEGRGYETYNTKKH